MMNNREFCDGEEVIVDEYGELVPNSKMRKLLYKSFTYLKFGHLGRGNHIPIPFCVVQQIQLLHLDPNGNYIGFHERLWQRHQREHATASGRGR